MSLKKSKTEKINILCDIENEHKYIIFLSDITISILKTKCCIPIEYFKKRDIKNFYKLYQKERLLTILDSSNIDFNKYYFDDIDTNIPKYDNLYIRVNKYFYVSYSKYLRLITQFNFNLYSHILARFGLKKIRCEISHNIMTKRNISNQLNFGLGKLNVNFEKKDDKNVVEIRGEKFNIDRDDYKRILDFRKLSFSERRKQIIEFLPANKKLQNIMFLESLDMNKINKAIDENLSTLNYSFDISVNEIKNIYIGLGESYTPLNISNNFSFELETNENQSILINYEFYTLAELESSYKAFENHRNQKEYYLSSSRDFKGPWPTGCKKIKIETFPDFSKALAYSTLEIKKSPEIVINEIRQDFSIYNGINYSVHTWNIKSNDENKFDITYGIPPRYLHFSNIKFHHRKKLIYLIKQNGF
jgi:hypothetical protein